MRQAGRVREALRGSNDIAEAAQIYPALCWAQLLRASTLGGAIGAMEGRFRARPRGCGPQAHSHLQEDLRAALSVEDACQVGVVRFASPRVGFFTRCPTARRGFCRLPQQSKAYSHET